jgi:hypothetical protein
MSNYVIFEAMDNRILELAIKGLQAERDWIEKELAELHGRMNGSSQSASVGLVSGRRTAGKVKPAAGGLTAAGRKKLSVMMKARWAERRRANPKGTTLTSSRTRNAGQNRVSGRSAQSNTGGLTAAGRKKLADLMRRRWAAKRKGS